MSIEYVLRTSPNGHFEELPLNVGGVASGLRNLLVNPGFDIWLEGAARTVGLNTDSETASRWYALYTGDTEVSNTVSRQPFEAGQTGVAGEPSYYWHWEIGESSPNPITAKKLWQSLPDVRTLQGSTATVSFSIRTNAVAGRSVDVSLLQSFGTGGSPSAPVQLTDSFSLTPTGAWQKITAVFTVASVAGKILGSNSDDALFIYLSFPFGPSGGPTLFVDIADVQLETGGSANDFAKRIYSEDLAICKAFQPVVPIDGGASSTTDIEAINADSVTIPANTAVSFISSGLVNSFVRADSSASGALPVHGFTTDSSAVAGAANVRMLGPLEGFSGLTAGAYYYSSASLRGAVTSVVPSALNEKAQRIGFALTGTRLNVTPGLSVKRSAPAVGGGGVDLNVINSSGGTLAASTVVATLTGSPNGEVQAAVAASGIVAPAFAILPFSIANGATGVARVSGPLSGFSGLTPGAIYYLDPGSAGGITSTAPSGAGQFVQRLGEAVNSTTLNIEIFPGYLKAAAAATDYTNVLQPWQDGHFQEIAVATSAGSGGGGGGGGTLNPEYPLSRDKSVTVDSTYPFASDLPANAVNGDLTDKWSSDYGDGSGLHWIEIDLGTPQEVGHWKAVWAWTDGDQYNAQEYELQYKVDTSYTTIDAVTGNTVKVTSRDITPTTAQIWRLYITVPSQPVGGDTIVRLTEIKLYSPGHGTSMDTLVPTALGAVGVTAQLPSLTSIGAGSPTALPLSLFATDAQGFLGGAANTLTVPSGQAGTYLLTAALEFGADTAGNDAGETLFYVNGSLVQSTQRTCNDSLALRTRLHTEAVLQLSVGDEVTLKATGRNSGLTQYVHDGLVSLLKIVGDSTTAGSPAATPVTLSLAAGATVSSGVTTAISFDTAVYDPGSLASGGGLTLPTAGLYYFLVTGQFSADATGGRRLTLLKNGSTTLETVIAQPVTITGAFTRIQLSTVDQITAGDTIEVTVSSTASSDLTIPANGLTLSAFKIPSDATGPARAAKVVDTSTYSADGDSHATPAFNSAIFYTLDTGSPDGSNTLGAPLDGLYMVLASAEWHDGSQRLVDISDGNNDDVRLPVAFGDGTGGVTTQMTMVTYLTAGQTIYMDSMSESGTAEAGFSVSLVHFTGGTGTPLITPGPDGSSGLTGGGGSGTVTLVSGTAPIVITGSPTTTPTVTFNPSAAVSMNGQRLTELALEQHTFGDYPAGLTTDDRGRLFYQFDLQRILYWDGATWITLATEVAPPSPPTTVNHFDNSQMSFWERGILSRTVENGTYPGVSRHLLPDRWLVEVPALPDGVSVTLARHETDPGPWGYDTFFSPYNLAIAQAGGAAGAPVKLITRLPNGGAFADHTVGLIVSVKAVTGSPIMTAKARIWTGSVTTTWVDAVPVVNNLFVGSFWGLYHLTFDMPALADFGGFGGALDHFTEFSFEFDFNGATAQTLEITNLQLEQNNAWHDFVMPNYSADRLACQRFYEKGEVTVISSRSGTAVQYSPSVAFKNEKAAVPTMTLHSHNVALTPSSQVVNRETDTFGSGTAVSDLDVDGFNITYQGPTGTAPGDRINFGWAADCELP